MESQTSNGSRPLTDDDVAIFCRVVGVAPRQMRHAQKTIAQRYDLGPRGAWILGMIQVGINSPSRLTEAFGVGRSLVTAELNRLAEAGLIVSRKLETDGRRFKLTLTAEGKAANKELAANLARLMSDRLGGYSSDEIMLCARILRDFAGADAQFFEPPGETPSAAQRE